MTPEQAQQQRDLAFQNAMLGLGRLESSELDPNGASGRAAAILYDLQQRIRRIETAEARGDATAQPTGSYDERVEQAMAAMAQRGIGRV